MPVGARLRQCGCTPPATRPSPAPPDIVRNVPARQRFHDRHSKIGLIRACAAQFRRVLLLDRTAAPALSLLTDLVRFAYAF